jgi:hypothetical protein
MKDLLAVIAFVTICMMMVHASSKREVRALFCKSKQDITTFIGLESDQEELIALSLGECRVEIMTVEELRIYKRRFYEGRR